MRAWDITVTVPHRPGSLASIGEEFGAAGINIEGFCCAEFEGHTVLHLLVDDAGPAGALLAKYASVGYEIRAVRQVMVAEIEDRPGMLGELSRRIADSGINLTVGYLATGTRVVFGAEDVKALERAWEKISHELQPIAAS